MGKRQDDLNNYGTRLTGSDFCHIHMDRGRGPESGRTPLRRRTSGKMRHKHNANASSLLVKSYVTCHVKSSLLPSVDLEGGKKSLPFILTALLTNGDDNVLSISIDSVNLTPKWRFSQIDDKAFNRGKHDGHEGVGRRGRKARPQQDIAGCVNSLNSWGGFTEPGA